MSDYLEPLENKTAKEWRECAVFHEKEAFINLQRIKELEAEVLALKKENIDIILSWEDDEKTKHLKAEVERLKGEGNGIVKALELQVKINKKGDKIIRDLNQRIEKLRAALEECKDYGSVTAKKALQRDDNSV